METVGYRLWEFQYDPEVTRVIYAARKRGRENAAECSCPWCENFRSLREQNQVYPAEVLGLLERFGVDYRLESELLCSGPLESGLYRYLGWFPFVGLAMKGPDANQPGKSGSGIVEAGHYEAITDQFSMGFTSWTSFSGSWFDNHPTLELVFSAELPWILEEPAPDDSGSLRERLEMMNRIRTREDSDP